MDKNKDYSVLIAQTLNRNFSFEQAKLKMYHDDDIYYRIPRLVFRLKEKNSYGEIKKCIESFDGILKWTLYRYEFSRLDNHVIAPSILYELERNYFKTEQKIDEKEILPIDEYKSICEKAIEDIPKLAEHIQKYFNIE